ncbi:hypothetical protein M0813_19775 [Anaeramoeba flamelloides]|uniref:Uncharacterized protein n=1 Tax=Anaeramoeba flamelloides TaxID=1746091 RepID=A0ABQ8YN49_9EUKA|nr:hypothetical protein M0813_19775 [Anaeramoeba flamelloides]
MIIGEQFEYSNQTNKKQKQEELLQNRQLNQEKQKLQNNLQKMFSLDLETIEKHVTRLPLSERFGIPSKYFEDQVLLSTNQQSELNTKEQEQEQEKLKKREKQENTEARQNLNKLDKLQKTETKTKSISLNNKENAQDLFVKEMEQELLERELIKKKSSKKEKTTSVEKTKPQKKPLNNQKLFEDENENEDDFLNSLIDDILND